MIELVPIKIKVIIGPNGKFLYPNFKGLQFFRDNPEYKALPLYYDKVDCKTETEDSPLGIRWCMKLVPPAFAEEALTVFPGIVFEMTEEEAEEFYNEKVTAHQSENIYDVTTLQGLKIELELREKLGQDTAVIKNQIERAIDPDDEEPGIKRNKNKKWKDLKQNLNATIIKSKS